jgi:3-dehydroquinate dehydratase type I
MQPSLTSKLIPTTIKASTTDDLIAQINTYKPDQLLMIRLDQLSDFSSNILSKLKDATTGKTVYVSFRSPKVGGQFQITIEGWRLIMENILSVGFDYVEIEMPNIMQVYLTKKHLNTKLVVCYASSTHTPGYRNLRKVQKRMRGFDPYIQAFDTKIKTNDDLQNLVRLLVSKKKSDNLWVNFKELEISEKTLDNLFN